MDFFLYNETWNLGFMTEVFQAQLLTLWGGQVDSHLPLRRRYRKTLRSPQGK